MAVQAQLKLLVNLALIDGEVAENERNYISNIGVANGMKKDAIDSLWQEKHDAVVPSNLRDEQKFDYLFSLVQLMKIDERLYKEEIKYCAYVAAKLGYRKEVMFELMLKVSSDMKNVEIEALRKVTSAFLIN